jgi:hypothetical protein
VLLHCLPRSAPHVCEMGLQNFVLLLKDKANALPVITLPLFLFTFDQSINQSIKHSHMSINGMMIDIKSWWLAELDVPIIP